MSRDMLAEQGLSTCSYCGQAYRWECLCWPYNGRSKEAVAYRAAIAAGRPTEAQDAMEGEGG